eukprot:COSAG01_NODE_37077_length_508_cov_3.009780_1_plen_66_part_01
MLCLHATPLPSAAIAQAIQVDDDTGVETTLHVLVIPHYSFASRSEQATPYYWPDCPFSCDCCRCSC